MKNKSDDRRNSMIVLMSIVLAFSFGFSTTAKAGFSEGMTAYKQGHYAEALKQWIPLARKGDASAEAALGNLYSNRNSTVYSESRARTWYERAARHGNPDAQLYMGKWNNDAGHTLTAERWLRLAAKQGNAQAEYELATGIDYERSPHVTDHEAVELLKKSAEQNVTSAAANLAEWYERGQHGLVKDPVELAAWRRRAAELGDVSAQFKLGEQYRDGKGVAQDYAQAMLWLKKVADHDDASYAQIAVGDLYFNGQGVPADSREGLRWYLMAAGQRFSEDAKLALARRYLHGDKLAQDYGQAKLWLEKSNEDSLTGQEEALAELAGMYEKGLGVPADSAHALRLYLQAAQNNEHSSAVSWFKSRAENGDAEAQYYLGTIYQNGDGRWQDREAQALSWLRKSAQQDFALAQANLGFRYANGIDVSQDRVMAHMFYTLASAGGKARAVNCPSAEADGLSVDENSKAQALAAAWRVGAAFPEPATKPAPMAGSAR